MESHAPAGFCPQLQTRFCPQLQTRRFLARFQIIERDRSVSIGTGNGISFRTEAKGCEAREMLEGPFTAGGVPDSIHNPWGRGGGEKTATLAGIPGTQKTQANARDDSRFLSTLNLAERG